MKKVRKKEFTQWLEHALPFDVWVGSDRKTVKEARDYIFKEIGETHRLGRKKHHDREALLMILLNLWIGFFIGKPIRVSMDSNYYSRNQVYGKLCFRYRRMKRLINSLERQGYLERAPGYYDKYGRQTRIWTTVKLIRVFVEEYKIRPIGDINTTEPTELIQLRNEFKIKNDKIKKSVKVSEDVAFDPTDKTLKMSSNLEQLNTLSRAKKITVCLNEDDKVSLEDLMEKILTGLIKGRIELVETDFVYQDSVLGNSSNIIEDKGNSTDHRTLTSTSSIDEDRETDTDSIEDHTDMRTSSNDLATEGNTADSSLMEELDIEVLSYKGFSYPIALYKSMVNLELNKTILLYTITHSSNSPQYQDLQPKSALFLHLLWVKKLLSLMNARSKKNEFMKEDRPLADFGIKKLEFEIKVKDMHRVFNRASKKFDKGGRFYGPYYQGMPSKFRKSILIDGKKTVEYDYSGLHIRMLYHELGIKFEEDPYAIGDGSERDKYKLVSLISINAAKRGSHIAVRDALKDAGFDTGKDLRPILKMMDNFKARHAPIKEFLFSGAGIDLQNKDSRIMEKIMTKLHDMGIVALPIHDSAIVEEQYSSLLEEIMIQVYEEEMKFTPKLKIAS